ncbi:MAG: TIGR03663 family protein, partial [Halodesulfurarchaeum sp.]
AGVGIGLVVGRGLDAHTDRDWVGVALAAIVVLAVVGQIGVTAIETSYRNPQADSNPLVQYGQPAGMMQDTVADVEAVSRAHDGGTDVLFYGEHFYVENESDNEEFPAVPDWLNRMPLPWYLERSGAVVDSSTSSQSIDGDVPVVITRAENYDEVSRHLSGYDDYTYELTSTDTETVFFVDRSYLNETETTD